MHFDEVYHARTATEFLQDWRYGEPHDDLRVHPPAPRQVRDGGRPDRSPATTGSPPSDARDPRPRRPRRAALGRPVAARRHAPATGSTSPAAISSGPTTWSTGSSSRLVRSRRGAPSPSTATGHRLLVGTDGGTAPRSRHDRARRPPAEQGMAPIAGRARAARARDGGRPDHQDRADRRRHRAGGRDLDRRASSSSTRAAATSWLGTASTASPTGRRWRREWAHRGRHRRDRPGRGRRGAGGDHRRRPGGLSSDD